MNNSDSSKLSRDDVARLAGVSPTTVSRVINNRGYISQKTRDRVDQAMKTLGYYPNELARSLSLNRSQLIGLIFPSLTNPFQAQLIQQLENILSTLGYKILMCNSHHDSAKEQHYLEMLRRNQVEGVIVNSLNETLADYAAPDLHVVSIDRRINALIPTISCNNYHGGVLATQALVDAGCRNILYIGNVTAMGNIVLDADRRYRAYLDIVDEHELLPHTLDLDFQAEHKVKYSLIEQYLTHTDIDGIFTDDLSAAIAMEVARELGISVPEQLKVVGFDGAPLTQLFMPQLTTIAQPINQIAELAAHTLIAMINGDRGSVKSHDELPVKLRRSLSC